MGLCFTFLCVYMYYINPRSCFFLFLFLFFFIVSITLFSVFYFVYDETVYISFFYIFESLNLWILDLIWFFSLFFLFFSWLTSNRNWRSKNLYLNVRSLFYNLIFLRTAFVLLFFFSKQQNFQWKNAMQWSLSSIIFL